MSTQIQIHIRTEEMHEEMLRSEGIIGGMLAQFASTEDYFDEFNDAIRDADSVIVGDSLDEWPKQVSKTFNNLETIDNVLIKQVEAVFDDADVSEEKEEQIIDFLREHSGEEAFTIHW